MFSRGHGFDLCRGLRFFFVPRSCHISLPSLIKIQQLFSLIKIFFVLHYTENNDSLPRRERFSHDVTEAIFMSRGPCSPRLFSSNVLTLSFAPMAVGHVSVKRTSLQLSSSVLLFVFSNKAWRSNIFHFLYL